MSEIADRIRTRLIPAVLTALGVTLLAAGLLSYGNGAAATPDDTPEPSATADAGATPSALITLPPIGTGGPPSESPSNTSKRVATRVRIAALKIDLAVVRQPSNADHPYCDVAMYYENPALRQPGQGRATYLYAHAQKGMFLPLLTASKVSNGKKMLGMVVEVWTSDDQRFLYVITQVRRHVAFDKVFDTPFRVRTEQLWLQTSEGVGNQPKLQVVAEPLSQEPASQADAHPAAKPRTC